jgi:NAD(P)-dependent dehydrogenase (short-subunit alcohol dehydrogenase family)
MPQRVVRRQTIKNVGKDTMSKRLENQIAIVTGSSSGNGRAIALALSAAGATIVCSDLEKEARKEGYEDDIEIDTDDVIQNRGGKSPDGTIVSLLDGSARASWRGLKSENTRRDQHPTSGPGDTAKSGRQQSAAGWL